MKRPQRSSPKKTRSSRSKTSDKSWRRYWPVLAIVGPVAGLAAGLALGGWLRPKFQHPAPVASAAPAMKAASPAMAGLKPVAAPEPSFPQPGSALRKVAFAPNAPASTPGNAPAGVAGILHPPLPSAPPPAQAAADPPWQRFAVAPPPIDGRPMVALIIDDMGVDHARSARAIKLPWEVTLAFLPYAHDLARQDREARAAGHELLLHMPMQPEGHEDPGPDVLKVGFDRAQILERLRGAMAALHGFVGVNNHMGSRFTADPAGMAVVMEELKRQGYLFVDSKTTPHSVADGLAVRYGVPHADREVFLDDKENVPYVLHQLAITEAIAKRYGAVIAIGHPHDATLAALAQWLPGVEKRGLVLVPVSTVVRWREHRAALRAVRAQPAPRAHPQRTAQAAFAAKPAVVAAPAASAGPTATAQAAP